MGSIIVGVSGGKSSVPAVIWALRQARLTGASVRLVHAVGFPDTVSATRGRDVLGRMPATASGLAEEAGRLLRTTLDEVGVEAAGVHVVEEVVTDRGPAQALIDRSVGAELLVIGSRGGSGDPRVPLGSVSRYCSHHARCPVVIVPSDSPPSEEAGSGAGGAGGPVTGGRP